MLPHLGWNRKLSCLVRGPEMTKWRRYYRLRVHLSATIWILVSYHAGKRTLRRFVSGFSRFRTLSRSHMFHIPHHLICIVQSRYYLMVEVRSPHPASLEPPLSSPSMRPAHTDTHNQHSLFTRISYQERLAVKKDGRMKQKPNVLLSFSDKVYSLLKKIQKKEYQKCVLFGVYEHSKGAFHASLRSFLHECDVPWHSCTNVTQITVA
jgi:hypothetical protein